MKNSKNNKRGLWLLILGLSILFGGVFLYFYIVSGFGECRLGESINFKGKYYQSCAPIGTKVELANTYRLKIETQPWSGWSRGQPPKETSFVTVASSGQKVVVPYSGEVKDFLFRIDDFSQKQVTLTVNGVSVNQGDRIGKGYSLRDCGRHTLTLSFLETAELHTCTLDGGVSWSITYL